MRTPPTLHRLDAHGVALAVWDWAGPGETLLCAHATGFHARCWDKVIALLPEYRCLALDLRGHGRSDTPDFPRSWRPFAEDVAAVARAYGLRGAVGIGHSAGGHAVALAASIASDAFARLVLIDPVAFAPERYTGVRTGEHFVAQRRDRWPSVEAMIERFAPRSPFNRWAPGVLRDYCEYGLLPAPDGDGLTLACPPAFEASVYQASSAAESNPYPAIATLPQPTLVIRATGAQRTGSGPDFSVSPTAPDFAAHFPHGRDLVDPDHTHFLPMESPEATAGYVREAVG